MTTIIKLLKSKTIWFSLILAALSVAQGYVGLLPGILQLRESK